MARRQVYPRIEMMWIILLVATVYLDCVYCMENNTLNDATSTTSLIDDATPADGMNPTIPDDNLPQTGGSTSPITVEVPTSATEETLTTEDSNTISPPTKRSEDNLMTTVNATTQPGSGNYGSIHWLLFTGWEMPLVMVCVEIFAYCVTIFIVFGFSQKRSRVKRFGHFSWKRPNPYQEDMPSVSGDGDHYISGQRTMMETRFTTKKQSIRGHRP